MKRIGQLLLGVLISLNAHASGGAIDMGGGNVSPGPKLSLNDIGEGVVEAWLVQAPRVFAYEEMRFHWAEYSRDPGQAVSPGWKPVEYEIARKLFGSAQGETVFDFLKKGSDPEREFWRLKTEGPCLDAGGNPADASVVDPSVRGVCYSVDRLAMKLNRYDKDLKLITLTLHEVGHLAGLNEEEAAGLQSMIERRWDIFGVESGSLSQTAINQRRDLDKDLSAVIETTESANRKLAAGKSFEEVCKSVWTLGGTMISIFTELDMVEPVSVSFIRASAQKNLLGMIARGEALRFACNDTIRPEARLSYEERFEGKTEIPLQQYLTGVTLGVTKVVKNPPAYPADQQVRVLSPGDRAALAAELAAIHQAAKTVKEEMVNTHRWP